MGNNFTIRSLDISMIEGVKPENAECTEKEFSCCHKNDTIPISITPSTTSSTLESIDSTTITEHNMNGLGSTESSASITTMSTPSTTQSTMSTTQAGILTTLPPCPE